MPTENRSVDALVFAGTIGVGACLLFQVQFILAKQILPWFGGAPAVWTTCMLFFQVGLLLGYVYAHLLTRRPTPKRQRTIHVVALALSAGLFATRATFWPSPITAPDTWAPSGGEVPSVAILGLLLFTIGLPFLVLSATGPLLQSWYARRFPGQSPYRLYALSNIGSLLGLLSYPFMVEPLLSVTSQGWGWSAGFGVFAVGCGWAAMIAARRGGEAKDSGAPVEEPHAASPSVRAYATWFSLAMVASVMLLAMTSQIALEVAVVPFLWMVPLALYLLSFVLCFEYEGAYRRDIWVPALYIGASLTAVVNFMGVLAPVVLQLLVYLGTLMCACMVCHGELVRSKPSPRFLTGFYLVVATGGAAGGAFTGVLAPAVFVGLWELPLALVAACVIGLVFGVSALPPQSLTRRTAKSVGGVHLILMSVAFVLYARHELKNNLHVSRSFFGVLRVDAAEEDGSKRTRLRHGRITHGFQLADPELATQPSSYYGPTSGVGLAITTHSRRQAGAPLHVGVVGLGAGTLASYAAPGDRMRFYEIDPDVVALSTGAQPIFTYLRDTQADVSVVLGDARMRLEREPPQEFDVLVVDAFSSDAIPVHLLTVEALRAYVGHLHGDKALLALHISNRYLDLDPIVRGAAEAVGLVAIRVNDSPDDDSRYSPSDWILLAADHAAFEGVTGAANELDPPSRDPPWPRWTDEYTNLLDALK